MKWVWIVVIGVLAISTAIGNKRGMIKTIFSLCSAVLALVLTAVLAPIISSQLQENEKLYQYVSERVEESLAGSSIEEADTESAASQVSAINNLPLPKVLQEKLLENHNREVYKAMAVNTLKEYVVKYMTGVIINAGTFVVVYAVIHLALWILAMILDIISKLPVLNTLNKTMGALAGFVQGLVIVWILCILLTAFSSAEFAKEVYAQIEESKVLSLIYNNNLLLHWTSKIF